MLHTLVLVKEDWIRWLTKAAAAIIISSLQGAVLVTEFYNIMTSATSAQVFSNFPLKLQSVTFRMFKMQHNGASSAALNLFQLAGRQ